MKLYGGIDLHSNNSVINLVDEDGEVVTKRRLSNNLREIILFLEPYSDSMTGLVVESTYNWYWLVDGLMDAGYTVHLANTAAIQQYSGLKHSDDESDANWLANMLRLDILPEGYIYPKEERMLRDLLRKRLQLVQQRTQNLLSIQGIYDRHLNIKLNADRVKRLKQDQIEEDFNDTNVCLAVGGTLVIQQCLSKQINQIELSLKRQLKLRKEFIGLTSIDGIGLILALTIMLETGDISRFKTVGQYASYCRCVNGGRYSNGKKKGKTNTKNGNKYLAWGFIEAAHFAIRFNDVVKRYYQRKMSKTSVTVARKTVAHKLARACFYVLRDQVEFDVNRVFGCIK